MRLTATQSLLACYLIASLSSGCKKSADEPIVSVPPAGLAGTGERAGSINLGHPKSDQKLLTESHKDRKVITGKIVEAIYKDSFAYVRLDVSDGENIWVAIVNEKPTVGETIKIQEQAVLKDFHSKSLDRTFASIVFGALVE